MSVIRARWISLGLMVLAIITMLIGLRFDGETMTVVLCIAGVLMLVASFVIQFVFHRCPHCGRFLDGNYWGEHCQFCGNQLTEEKQ